jgi:enoyl-[acyl-carrier protein] reductase/trans-2-enoyl-CoA reductase (NAD+)
MKVVLSKFNVCADRLFSGKEIPTDEKGRILLMIGKCALMFKQNSQLWQEATTENFSGTRDLEGYRSDFLQPFGFGFDGVDKAEADEMVGVDSIV